MRALHPRRSEHAAVRRGVAAGARSNARSTVDRADQLGWCPRCGVCPASAERLTRQAISARPARSGRRTEVGVTA
jgi:hypothetical protein